MTLQPDIRSFERITEEGGKRFTTRYTAITTYTAEIIAVENIVATPPPVEPPPAEPPPIRVLPENIPYPSENPGPPILEVIVDAHEPVRAKQQGDIIYLNWAEGIDPFHIGDDKTTASNTDLTLTGGRAISVVGGFSYCQLFTDAEGEGGQAGTRLALPVRFLKPYVGQTLYGRYYLRLPQPLDLAQGDGLWTTLGIQGKDYQIGQARFALNAEMVEGKVLPVLQHVGGTIKQVEPQRAAYEIRAWNRVDYTLKLHPTEGAFTWSINGKAVFTSTGPTCTSEGIHLMLALYGNAFKKAYAQIGFFGLSLRPWSAA